MLYKPSFAWYIYSYSANGCIFASSLVCACIQFRSAEIFSVRRDTEGSEILIYFNCDYTEGCHPNILKRLCETNMTQTVGYGEDEICDLARAKIRKACGREDVDVHFLVGGTQTNATVIAAILRPHQGALSADTGHINVHETGAVEATGHKVLPLPSTPDGKITAEQVENAYLAHVNDASFEHMVQPKLVYISLPTENGGLYSKAELTALHDVCTRCGLYLFIDGARLGYGLTAPENDVALADLCALSDVFYIGGTKVGALFGEAVVITNPALKTDFRYHIKQRGGMLAKGRSVFSLTSFSRTIFISRSAKKPCGRQSALQKRAKIRAARSLPPRRRTSSSPFSRILRSKSSRKSTSIPIGRAWTKHTAPSAFVQAGRRRTKTWTHSAKTLRPSWQNNAGLRLSAPFRGGKPV